jgi:molybdopterin converting factor small subunit
LTRTDVLLFAAYADWIGAPAVSVEVPDGATVQDVVDAVRRLPGGDRLPASPLVAVDQAWAAADAPVAGAREIALIPPVAGG